MRRYRKGDTFRPPTAAESAVNADALEGFRRRVEVPQTPLSRGSKILVKTPVGGIAARDGTTIYSSICTRCVETSTAEEKEILETDEELEVFNLDTTAVSGEIYVQTGLTLHGTRCVEVVAPCQHRVIEFSVISAAPFVDEELPVCTAALASVTNISCCATTPAIGDEVIVWDPSFCWLTVPLDLLIGSIGTAVEMARVGDWDVMEDCLEYDTLIGNCWWKVTGLCCTENIYGQ